MNRMRSLQEQESNSEHKARADEVRQLKGLYILGTERHEARRSTTSSAAGRDDRVILGNRAFTSRWRTNC